MSTQDAPTKTISDYEATLAKADTAVASFEKDDKTFIHVLRGFLRVYPTMIPALVLLVSVIAFSIIAPRFLGIGALSTVLKQVTVTGFVALAQTLVILTAGIDLSVGAILVVSSLVMGNLAVMSGVPVLLAVLIGIVLGGLMGALNGVLVANPPYGVRLSDTSELEAFYPKLGDALKANWSGWRAYFFTGDPLLPKGVRLKASKRTPLFNGAIECRLFEYLMVAGSARKPKGGEA